jgi:hypothetical protein
MIASPCSYALITSFNVYVESKRNLLSCTVSNDQACL